jgi:hypothetical protein
MGFHTLYLTDGTTTVYLSQGGIVVEQYTPKSPEVSVNEFTAEALADGDELVSATRRNVVESINVLFVNDTNDAVRASIRSVEALLRAAEDYATKQVGAAVYLCYQPGKAGDVYRSQVLSGRVELGEEAMRLGWAAASAPGAILLKRVFYWEAASEVELPLESKATTPKQTGGVSVYNRWDGTYGNYFHAAAADVTGVLPAPVRLEAYYASGIASISKYFVGQNVWATPASLNPILECESATAGAGVVLTSIGGPLAASNSHHAQLVWTGTAETMAMYWDLSAAMLGYCANRYFRLLLKYQYSCLPPSGAKVRAKLMYPSGGSGTQVMAETPQTTLTYLTDLGVLRIPPYRKPSYLASYASLSLMLYFERASSADDLYLDYALMLPLDGFRQLQGSTMYQGYTLIDDGIEGIVSAGYLAGGYQQNFYSLGQPLMVYPGKAQRFYMIVENSTHTTEIEHTVRAYYRPRRLTV